MKPSALPVPREDDEQRAVVDWLTVHGILFAHVPNGGQRSRIEAAIMQGLGVRSGVPDLLIFDRPPALPDAPGAAIEMKRQRGGVLSDAQAEWIMKLQARGWATAVCEGADAALAVLEAWGYGRRR